MRKLLAIIAPLMLGAGICGMLRADDSPPPTPAVGGDPQIVRNESLWWVEHTAAIAGNAESSGVQAVIEARELLKSREPQVQIDFFNKALYDVKNRAIQRQVRMELYGLYKEQGQNDRALDQLQQLMMDQ
jgi:hypothetical protein